MHYRRVLLKLSGEALMGPKTSGHDLNTMQHFAEAAKEVRDAGIQLSIVVGGGNIWRGKDAHYLGIDRVSADQMGMLGTIINALALRGVMENLGLPVMVLSAISMDGLCQAYSPRKAIHHLNKNEVVICAAGTGNPFCTTDSAAVLRAIETNCDLLCKGTQVDGVYSADPLLDQRAERFGDITYDQVIEKNLRIMDLASIVLARDAKLPIKVFSISEPKNFKLALLDQGNFTNITR